MKIIGVKALCNMVLPSVFLRNRFIRNLGAVLSVSFLCTGVSFAAEQFIQPSDAALADLDTQIREYMEDKDIPGGLVALASRGELRHLRTYGMANVELLVPVTIDSVFEIGSISKQFVSAAIMLLVEDGKLELDDPIQQYLHAIPGKWFGVTIRQLLTHTSGIPDYEEIRTYDVYRYRLTAEDVMQIAHSRPMDFEPGTGWYYSNTNYFLASMIVERVEGRPFGDVLQSRIFGPLEMTQTRMADPEAIIPNRAAGYWLDKAGKLINRNPTETSSTLGAGGILSSVKDLAKWDESLYGNQLLTAESKAEMWRAAVLPDGSDRGYGLGWRVFPISGLNAQHHSGQVAGFVARFVRFPDHEAAIIVFMNRYEGGSEYPMKAVLHTFVPSLGAVPQP